MLIGDPITEAGAHASFQRTPSRSRVVNPRFY